MLNEGSLKPTNEHVVRLAFYRMLLIGGEGKMSNEKAADATLMTTEFLKWKRPQTCQQIATIMDQAIKQVFQNIGS